MKNKQNKHKNTQTTHTTQTTHAITQRNRKITTNIKHTETTNEITIKSTLEKQTTHGITLKYNK